MSKKSRIDIRVEEGIISMLNTLENQELTQNFIQKTRSEIIIDAIKMYYLMHTNGESQSQFMDMIELQINKIVEPYFQAQADLISKYYDYMKNPVFVKIIDKKVKEVLEERGK